LTSSQPITTPNAINFTPDNKHAYAYSGIVGVTNIEVALLEFETNSEYIIARFGLGCVIAEGDDMAMEYLF